VFLVGDCTVGLKKKLEKAGIKSFHIRNCPPVEPFLCWSILDRNQWEAPAGDLSGQEFNAAGLLIRDRMMREEVPLNAWIKTQKEQRE
jgi:hypothetical protein